MDGKYKRGEHPNSRANMAPMVKPGEVLNPEGKNQHTYRIAFENQVEQILAEVVPGTGKDKRELLARVLFDRAAKGEPWAMALLVKRLWPERAELQVAVQGDPSQPIVVQHEYTDTESIAEVVDILEGSGLFPDAAGVEEARKTH